MVQYFSSLPAPIGLCLAAAYVSLLMFEPPLAQEDAERKKHEQQMKKQEAAALLKEEEATLLKQVAAKRPAPKVTRGQVQPEAERRAAAALS